MSQEKEQQILSILRDLYSIDASFKQYESELKSIISDVIASRPKIEIDEQFKENLRLLLLQKIQELKDQKEFKSINFLNIFRNSKLAYSAIGALLVAIILLPLIFLNQSKTEIPISPMNSQISFNDKGNRAFGDLSFTSQDLSAGEKALDSSKSSSSALGTGESASPAPLAPGTGTETGTETGTIYPYPPAGIISYHFIYKGEPIVLDEANVNVLKRAKNSGTGFGLGAIIDKMNLGIVDLKQFGELDAKQLTLEQGGDNGYSLYINFTEGIISINQNSVYYLKNIAVSCASGEKCMPNSSLMPSDIPEDSRLIEVANKFLINHGISATNYGAPEVNRYWEEQWAELGIMGLAPYISNDISILYPLVINGIEVYDSSGNKQGMTVSVNIPEMQVSNLYNLTTQKYDSSSYEAETDFGKILKVAEQGGIYGGYYDYSQGQVVDIEIGAPQKVYMFFYNYDQGVSEELLVPALLFPIVEVPQDAFLYQKSIIVPLAKELLKESDNIIRPMPVPMIEEAVPPVDAGE